MTTADISTQDLVTAFLIALLGFVAWLAVRYVREQRALMAETRRMNEWEQEIAGVTLPEWDGATFDWPDTGLSRYLDAFAEPAVTPALLGAPVPELPAASVPVSRISGPMCVFAPANDADAFISALRNRTDMFIALMAGSE